jgi:ech hydrogenase subunit A
VSLTGFELIAALLLVPAATAVLLAIIPNRPVRSAVVRISALVIALVSIYAAWTMRGGEAKLFEFHAAWAEKAAFWSGLGLTAFMLFLCRKITAKEWWIPTVIVAQEALLVWAELKGLPEVAQPFLFDNLSGIMAVIVGVVGSLICVYALGYMRDYQHHHHDMPDHRQWFFVTLFVFLSAMFGILFSNNLAWLYLFWEVTTMASFLLIGYSGTEEATRNAYRALGLNAIGGLSFVLGAFCASAHIAA